MDGNIVMQEEIQIKVSVCVMTYNQEKYIRQCLQSIVDQETEYRFEVIVADDCSTDGTEEIIKEFAERYPSLVRAVFHQANVGAGINYRSAHDLARGEYVAHCDGDDYWLPGKLSYQSNLLDQNPEASQCWGCAHLVDDDGDKIGLFPSRLARYLYPRIITARHIALSYALVGQHSTQMYRRKFKYNFDETRPVLDFWIAFNMALYGHAIYSKKIVGCYRVTKSPSMTRTASKKRATVDFLACHLADLIENNSQFTSEAVANIAVRRFVSNLISHDTRVIDDVYEKLTSKRVGVINFSLSLYYFLIQKIK